MSASLTVEIVPQEDCEGHHLDLFIEFSRERIRNKSYDFRLCDDCAVNWRGDIRRAMREAIKGDDEGVSI